MVYVAILAAVLLIGSLVRIRFLNSEIETLKAASFQLHALIESWDTGHPTGFTTSDTHLKSKEEMPKDLQELEIEYSWLLNEIDSKRETRTVWYGAAFVCLVVSLMSTGLAIQNAN